MTILRLAAAVFLVQAGFHGYTAALPLALSRGGVADAAIGLIVGVAAVVQIPAALVGGIALILCSGVLTLADASLRTVVVAPRTSTGSG